MTTDPVPGFYIIAREPGAEHHAIPTWASHRDNPADLDPDYSVAITRKRVDEVPGAYQLLDVLTAEECSRLVQITESLGYLGDAAVTLPRSIRHNDNATWIADDETNRIIWQRCAAQLQDEEGVLGGRRALGINSRFRFYRYGPGDYFGPHTDGAWPGSRVIDGELVANAYDDRYSLLSMLLFLSDGYEGGSTQFLVSRSDPPQPSRIQGDANLVSVRTPLGGVLCFPHGHHPLHCIHASEPVTSGTKYIIRTDVLFEL
jgi:predicted 2-oxoglutarate/Fe(II)-dependent dioxygenase YbiX